MLSDAMKLKVFLLLFLPAEEVNRLRQTKMIGDLKSQTLELNFELKLVPDHSREEALKIQLHSGN
jgi:hypothetical protein